MNCFQCPFSSWLPSSPCLICPHLSLVYYCRCWSWLSSAPVLRLQDRLSFIGPEEFIQTFAMKDPLENHKVPIEAGCTGAKNIISLSLFLDCGSQYFSFCTIQVTTLQNRFTDLLRFIFCFFCLLLIKRFFFLNDWCLYLHWTRVDFTKSSKLN